MPPELEKNMLPKTSHYLEKSRLISLNLMALNTTSSAKDRSLDGMMTLENKLSFKNFLKSRDF
jgi:hypothetical protein